MFHGFIEMLPRDMVKIEACLSHRDLTREHIVYQLKRKEEGWEIR